MARERTVYDELIAFGQTAERLRLSALLRDLDMLTQEMERESIGNNKNHWVMRLRTVVNKHREPR